MPFNRKQRESAGGQKSPSNNSRSPRATYDLGITPDHSLGDTEINAADSISLESFPGGSKSSLGRKEDTTYQNIKNSHKTGKEVSFVDHPHDSGIQLAHSSQPTNKVQPSRRQSLVMALRESEPGTSNKKKGFRCGMLVSKIKKFRLIIFFPILLSMWYSAAILFPPGISQHYSFIIWDKGALTTNADGQPTICPRASICSEGLLQIILISLARLSAFATYVVMGITFLSKMHSLNHFLSSTYFRTWIPFESMHEVHTDMGNWFVGLVYLHTISHYIRWALRPDMVVQVCTSVHFSGVIATVAMSVVVLSMSSLAKRWKERFTFEKRLNAHWVFVLVVIAICFHNRRAMIITMILFGMWALDFIYGIIYRTHALEVVEFIPLPGKSGTQMLWRNPEGFNPRSGEFVKIKLPWLSKGGEEWHPFSIYLNESTEVGLDIVLGGETNRRTSVIVVDPEAKAQLGCEAIQLEEFIHMVLSSDFINFEASDAPAKLMNSEAREQIKDRYSTTQVFMHPVGDWTKGLAHDLTEQRQLRACWVRGPYTSPYFVAQEYSHFVLMATGIGITPALGVMGQYPGFTRTKVLIWSTRDRNMLKFFAPLLKDCHLAVIFYTGKQKLRNGEIEQLQTYANIYIQQSRPESLTDTIATIILQFENHINIASAREMNEIELKLKAAWCVLYCGGSTRIRDDLKRFAKSNQVGFESELFDW